MQIVFCDNMIQESKRALVGAIISITFAIILVIMMKTNDFFGDNLRFVLATCGACALNALCVYRYFRLRCYRLVALDDRIVVKSIVKTKSIKISDVNRYDYKEVARSNIYAFTVYFLNSRATFYTRWVAKTIEILNAKIGD